MSETRLYVRIRGRVIGPFNFHQLKSLRDRGQFRRFHEVSQDGVHWAPASSLPELFANESAGRRASSAESRLETPRKAAGGNSPAPVAEWHYVNTEGQPCGPVSQEQLLDLLRKQAVAPTTLVWKEGMENWAPMASPETGLGLPPLKAGGVSPRGWIAVAAAILCLLLAGLGYAAYHYWWSGPTTDLVDRDKGDGGR